MAKNSKPRVVIIGAGFGGLTAARELGSTETDVILIDKENHHLFQPLLYQVATAALSPRDIASPIRAIIHEHKNVHVLMDEVESVNLQAGTVCVARGEQVSFDYLIVAPGARQSYFGHDEWEQFAPGLKTLADALEIREKVLLSFELAEKVYGTPEAQEHLTFVIVGGGPTGVELAGAIAEIALNSILPEFPIIKKQDVHVYLVEAGERLLSMYPKELSDRAFYDLQDLGVDVLLKTGVTAMDESSVTAGDRVFKTSNVIWAAGNSASPLLKTLGVEQDRAGRVIVAHDCSIPNHPNVFVIGDAAAFKDESGNMLPGVAQVAMQEAEYVADVILKDIPPQNRKSFHYNDRGSLATIGRAKAVGVIKGHSVKGFWAWFIWAVIHVWALIGFRSRLRVFAEWLWYYITFQPGARLIVYKNVKGKIDKMLGRKTMDF
jgi:NADH dehydrogenase